MIVHTVNAIVWYFFMSAVLDASRRDVLDEERFLNALEVCQWLIKPGHEQDEP